MTGLLLMTAMAFAGEADVLPARSAVFYSGVGVTSFSKMATVSSGRVDADRYVSGRVDLYGSVGLTRRLQLEAWLPVYTVRGVDLGRNTCSGDLCDPTTSVGSSGVALRRQLLRQPLAVSAGLAVQTDVWNAPTRGRYTSVGGGTTDVVPHVRVGRSLGLSKRSSVELAGAATYAFRFGRTSVIDGSSVRVPGDVLGGSVLAGLTMGPVSLKAGLNGAYTLWGAQWDSTWFDKHQNSVDRWNVLARRDLSVTGKLSLDLPRNMGLHLSGKTSVASLNGPAGAYDLAIGVHRYFAPGRKRDR